MHASADLKRILKRLRLSGILATLPERVAYANKTKITPLDFLELILQDEIERRDATNLSTRLDKAGFNEPHTLESFDWDANVTFDRNTIKDLFNLSFLERSEDVILLGPVGVGKTHCKTAVAFACTASASVRLALEGEV